MKNNTKWTMSCDESFLSGKGTGPFSCYSRYGGIVSFQLPQYLSEFSAFRRFKYNNYKKEPSRR